MNKILSSFLLVVSFMGYNQIAAAGTLSIRQLVNNILILRPIAKNSNFIPNTINEIGDDNGIVIFVSMAKIYIFDRFEKLLKQVVPLGAGWNVTYEGNPLPSSNYRTLVVYAEEEVQKEFMVTFTLKR